MLRELTMHAYIYFKFWKKIIIIIITLPSLVIETFITNLIAAKKPSHLHSICYYALGALGRANSIVELTLRLYTPL